jgi:4'-phosphopantetheinyl transferase
MFIDVWWIPLCRAAGDIPEPESVLSVEERRRAARFRFPEHALRFRVCHTAVRLVLGQYLGQPAETIELATDSAGKPRLAGNSGLRFNLSHSGDVALLAVTSELEVGVDVEAIRLDLPVDDLERYFTVCERERLRLAGSGEIRAQAFFRYWTRKEAVLKADGSGLSGGLDNLDISQCPENLVRFPAGGEEWWRVEDLDVPPGYAAALAAPPREWRVRWRGMM